MQSMLSGAWGLLVAGALLVAGCGDEKSCGEGYVRLEDGRCVPLEDAGAEAGGADASLDAGDETGMGDGGCEDVSFYRDADGDGHGDSSEVVEACAAPEGYVADGGDCDDANAAVYPGATEVCNGVDDDCDGERDEAGAMGASTFYRDADGDGHGDSSEVVEACAAPEGYVTDGGDCDDANAAVYPGATEVCNGIDDDCDARTDEGVRISFYEDADGDGFGDPTRRALRCAAPSGYVRNGSDCDDANAAVYPGATEVCNGIDDDCDGERDEAGAVGERRYYADCDMDGFAPTSAMRLRVCPSRLPSVPASCPGGVGGWTIQAPSSSSDTDCDDQEPLAFPGSGHWATVPRSDGSYDYDCDGVETRRWPNPSTQCEDFTTRAACEDPDNRYVLWHVSTPTGCGASYPPPQGSRCSWNGGRCIGTPSTVTQMCR